MLPDQRYLRSSSPWALLEVEIKPLSMTNQPKGTSRLIVVVIAPRLALRFLLFLHIVIVPSVTALVFWISLSYKTSFSSSLDNIAGAFILLCRGNGPKLTGVPVTPCSIATEREEMGPGTRKVSEKGSSSVQNINRRAPFQHRTSSICPSHPSLPYSEEQKI